MVQERNENMQAPPPARAIIAPTGNTPTPPLQQNASTTQSRIKSDLSYEIKGEVSQFVEIKLRPNQSIAGEITALMYYESGISMKMRAGAPTNVKKSFLEKLIGIGKAALSGQTLFMMYFTNTSQKELTIAFSMPYSGTIVPIDLSAIGKRIICQNDSFLCSSIDVQTIPALPKDLGGNFMTSSIPMQKIEGNGTLFLFCGGSLVQKNIVQGNPMHVTTGSTLALQPGVILKTKTINNVGITGQGHTITEISGSGRVWVQSLPYKRTKDNLIAQISLYFGLKPKKVNAIWGKK